MIKKCTICNKNKTIKAFSKDKKYKDGLLYSCKQCTKEYRDNYKKLKPEKFKYSNDKYIKSKDIIWTNQLTYRYGIKLEEYNRLLEKQGGVCAICKKQCSTKTRLSIDHDHITGKVRGLLCRRCNAGLGAFSDKIEELKLAIKYLMESM